MSETETALRTLCAAQLSGRRKPSGGNPNNTMMVVLPGSTSDENMMCVPSSRRQCESTTPPSKSSAAAAAAVEAPADPVSSTEVEYVTSEDLKDMNDIDVHLQTLLERLDSKDWVQVLEALNNVRQLAIFHPELLLPSLDKVVALVIKSLKNPRSALCKTAIMVTADMFKAYQDRLIDSLDPLLLQLLLKASQDKRFVCEEAGRALGVMTMCISGVPILQKLQPYVKHINPRVRAKASMCVYNSVTRLGSEGIAQFGFEPLIQMAASQMNDRLPEAREAARKLLVYLQTEYRKNPPKTTFSDTTVSEQMEVKQNPWEEFCLNRLPATTAQAVLRVTCVDNS